MRAVILTGGGSARLNPDATIDLYAELLNTSPKLATSEEIERCREPQPARKSPQAIRAERRNR